MKTLIARKNPSFSRDTKFPENFFESLVVFFQEDENSIKETLDNIKDSYVFSISEISPRYQIEFVLRKKFEFSEAIPFDNTTRIFKINDIVPGSDKKTMEEMISLEKRDYRFPIVRDIFLKGIQVGNEYFYFKI